MYNPNPTGRSVGDCAVRAVAMALETDWETAYLKMAMNGLAMGDMPSSNSVWGAVLRENGFYRRNIPDNCPNCYTFGDFVKDNPKGTFVLGTGTHTACAKDGFIFDAWNSEREIPTFVWYKDIPPKEEEKK
jgi:hypothetical protein